MWERRVKKITKEVIRRKKKKKGQCMNEGKEKEKEKVIYRRE